MKKFWKNPKVTGHQIWAVGKLSHLVDLMFPKKYSAWDMMCKEACCCDESANHQLLRVAAFWIIQILPVEECSSLMQNLMQIRCSTCSVILNVMATQYTCSLSGFYHPHWLVQWSHHCSHIHIPVLSPWLPGYINVAESALVILTIAGLFLDRPHNIWSSSRSWHSAPKTIGIF